MHQKGYARLGLVALLLAAPVAQAQQIEIRQGTPGPQGHAVDMGRVEDSRRQEQQQEYDRLREMEKAQWQREREQAIRDGHGVPRGPERNREAQRQRSAD
ncbi:hypothetical protein IAI58_15355 [Roseomonas marmotae]|uniref:hypothetical protein n=1 Tax=Roseomonas marmotae TaxID=2768161 RepID=UPI001AD75C3C|nr:hypothetical protein [Roseomonas marmotae]QTI78995.1 hypothetical protein IAI58_15355 [Roseomonas marmotae]